MNINFTIIKDLLRKSTVILFVLALVQVIYFAERPVIPENLEEYTRINGSAPIRFSADSGFYEEGFSLEMEAEGILPKGAEIHYTMDGREPGPQSMLYDGPIRLEVPAGPDTSDEKSLPAQNNDAETAAAQTEDDLQTDEKDEKGIETEEGIEASLDAEDGAEADFDEEGDVDSEEIGESLSSGGRQETETGGAGYLADNPAAGTRIYTVRAKIICGEEETVTQYAVYGIGTGVLPGEGEYIVCVDTEDANLYDYDIGILVGGRDLDQHGGSKYHGNYMMRGEEWGRPCHVAIFDGGGNLVDDRNAGMFVSGGMSRRLDQKSLNLAFGQPWCDADSDGHLGLDIFPDPPELEYAHVGFYTHLRLRARSQVPRTFRESLVCELAEGSGEPAVAASRSGLVFLNGSFYTLAELEPTFSNSYLAHRFDLPDTDSIEKMKGKESSVFRKMNVSDLFAADLTEEKNRETLEAAVDMDDYLLYYAINILDNNLDWPRNNVQAWRYTGEYDPAYPYTDGRIRFTVFDSDKTYNTDSSLEETFGTDSFVSMMTNTKRGFESRFRDVMKADSYRERFVTILCDLMNTSFETEHVLEKIREYYDMQEKEFRAYFSPEYMSLVEEDQKAALKAASDCNDMTRRDLEEYFGLKDLYTMNLSDSDGVNVRWGCMHLAPRSEYSCSYYKGVNITFTASPSPGWKFDHWEINGKAIENGGDPLKLTIDTSRLKGDSCSVSAAAVREKGERLIISEVQSAGNSDWIRLYNAGTTEINLGRYCISDDPENLNKYRLPSTMLPPGESCRIDCSDNNTGTALCCCNFNLSRNEVLSLTPDGETKLPGDSIRIPYMSEGWTYGRRDNGSSFCWFDRR